VRLDIDDIKKLIKADILNMMTLGENKGSTLVIYMGKALYVWKDCNNLFLKGKWLWNRKYVFSISDITN
jgi:hypothetical protein